MKKWFTSREAKKITAIIAILCMVLLFQIVGFLHFNLKLYDLSLDHSLKQVEELSLFIEKNLYMELEHSIHILKLIAAQLEKESPNLTLDDIKRIMQPYNKFNFNLMGVSDLDGKGVDFNGRKYDICYSDIRKDIEHGKVYISNVLKSDGQTLIFVAVPLYIDGKVEGIVWGKQALNDIANSIEFEDDSYKYFQIVDDKGYYLLPSSNKFAFNENPEFADATVWEEMDHYSYLRGISADGLREKMENGEKGNFYFEVEEEGRYVSYRPLNINKWYLFSVQVDDGLYEYVRSAWWLAIRFFVILTIGLLTIFGVIYNLIYTMYKKNARQGRKIQELNAMFRSTLLQTKSIPFAVDQKLQQVVFYGYPGEEVVQSRSFDEMKPSYMLEQGWLGKESYDAYCRLYQCLVMERKQCEPTVLYIQLLDRLEWVRVSIISDALDSEDQMIGVLEDYSEQREKDLQIETHLDDIKKIEEKSQIDFLTKVYNRQAFMEKIRQALEEGRRLNQTGALLILDLDHFKEVNDTLGHGMGDEVLEKTAQTLSQFFRKQDIVGRLGGDEFVVFVKDIRDVKAFERRLTELNTLLCGDYQKDGLHVPISASIGIMLTDSRNTTFAALYEKADQALYQVKKKSRNGWLIYSEKKLGKRLWL